MFSILIPIYNFDVRPLVEALVGQCRKELEGEFEILCFDDGSEREYLEKNRQLKVFPEVNYRELPQNLGRARIRNLLAESARFPLSSFYG
jgi:glycosyltransferase involved in cell wall biosynthesis